MDKAVAVVYAQDSNSGSGLGNTTNMALPNGKSIPINYLINTGKVKYSIRQK